jgi:hypothetical protein
MCVSKMAHTGNRMIDRAKKKLPARFYVSQTGRSPVREWIASGILDCSVKPDHEIGKLFEI